MAASSFDFNLAAVQPPKRGREPPNDVPRIIQLPSGTLNARFARPVSTTTQTKAIDS